MSDPLAYEVVVVGGGPAGMTTAIYATRLGHRTAVFEKEGGRHASVENVHNLAGVSEDVSGEALAKHAAEQFEEYGGDYHLDAVEDVSLRDEAVDASGVDVVAATDGGERFVVETTHATVTADRVVFATGFTDGEPSVPGLQRFTGRGLYYCLHCDAYALGDGRAFVLGHGDGAARDAMVLLNFTGEVELLLDGHDPEWSDETERTLQAHPVERIDEEVVCAFAEDGAAEPQLGGLRFADGTEREYLGGFAVYGKEYNTELAASLGCALADDGAIDVDDDFETSVDGAYAVGDATHGQNQTIVAMGDGAKAGMAIHKDLRRYPRPPDDLEDVDESAVPGAAADLRARMRLLRERETHAGLREPSSRQ